MLLIYDAESCRLNSVRVTSNWLNCWMVEKWTNTWAKHTKTGCSDDKTQPTATTLSPQTSSNNTAHKLKDKFTQKWEFGHYLTHPHADGKSG